MKGIKTEIDNVISVFVNSGYTVCWETRKAGNTKKKVLVISKKDENDGLICGNARRLQIEYQENNQNEKRDSKNIDR